MKSKRVSLRGKEIDCLHPEVEEILECGKSCDAGCGRKFIIS